MEFELIDGIIEDIEFIELDDNEYEEMFVYDIGVEDNHNFFAENTLVHNCHNIPSNTVFNTARQAKNAYYRIGVSATPWRDGGDDILIESALSIRNPKLSINASMLIRKGNLTPCNIVFLPIKDTFEWQGSYHNLYQRAIVKNEQRNNTIVNVATKMVEEQKRTVLILIKDINHGDILKSLLIEKIGKDKVEFLSGRNNAENRKEVLQSVKNGKIKVLIGSTIADEGLDLPILDCLILAGSGKSSTRAFQRVGRVIRLYKNKKDAIVFDFIDETKTFKRHALIRKALYETEPEWKIKVL